MPNLEIHLARARSLRADLLASPTVWLPRREILLEWLNAFLARAKATEYELGATEADDLAAVDRFLRTNQIPIARGLTSRPA